MIDLLVDSTLTFFIASVFSFFMYLSFLKTYRKCLLKKSKIAKFDSHDFMLMYSSLIMSIIFLAFSIISLFRIIIAK